MKTLVIHPSDKSTDFLKLIYEGKGFTVINDCSITKEELEEQIKKHDRIIMLGHGTPWGLLNPRKGGYLIDPDFADLLRTKQTISIWCNSDSYYKMNKLSDGNLHTGMIISEVPEAHMMLGYSPLTAKELLNNMELFASTIGKCIDYSPQQMKEYILNHYVGDDDITKFNRERIILI